MRALAEYVMQDRKRAIAMAMLFTVLPLCGWLALSIIGLVTLRRGLADGLIVLAGAAVPAIIAAILGQPLPLINDVLMGSLLVWGMALVLRSTQSWRVLLQCAAACAAIGLVVVFIAHPHLPNWWELRFDALLKKVDVSAWELGIPEASFKLMVHDLSRIATGLYATMVLTSGIMSLAIARWMQDKLYNPGGLKKELYEIRLGLAANAVLALVLLGVISGNITAVNVVFVIALPFVAAGISLVHRVSALNDKQSFWLIGFYTVLILTFPYILIVLVLAAFIDSGIDIYKRIQLKKSH